MPMQPRSVVLVAAFLLWSLGVWGGRIRNALADDTLAGWDRAAPVLLAASFVVPAIALIVGWFVHVGRFPWRGRAIPPPGDVLRLGTVAFCGWTIGVWSARVVDIVVGGDHELGFVLVHVVLAGLSILAAFLAGRAVGPVRHEADATFG